jgi:hypothetical protein
MAAAWALLDAVIDDNERVADRLGDHLEQIEQARSSASPTPKRRPNATKPWRRSSDRNRPTRRQSPASKPGSSTPTHPTLARSSCKAPSSGQRFDDVHGAGWRLISLDHEPLEPDPEAHRWFASLGGRVVAVPAGDPVYGRWFAEHDATAALQRPDFHLYGTAASPAAAAPLIDDLRTWLEIQPSRNGAIL